jgi:type IV pilus assembly protein PilY1
LSSCVHATTSCGDNLGNTYGIPLIRRLHNGQWAIIFGNGLGSTNYHAGVYVGLVDSSTGAVSFTWLDTGSGSSGSPNGIASVSSADLDGDHITDYLYAGDLLGNVWRFDLTSSNPADWAASTFGNPSATPLFTAIRSGVIQPITTKIQVSASNTGGEQRVLLGFGTGRAFPFTTASGTTYSSGTQSVYGIWDWDMTDWNNGKTTTNGVVIPPSTLPYAALSQIVSISPTVYRSFTRTNLLVNTLATNVASTTTTTGTRTLRPNDVCWNSSSTCPTVNNTSTTNTQYGWLFDLPGSSASTSCGGGGTCNEQIIYSPAFSGGVLFLNTTIAATTTVGQCTPALTSGWSMGFDMASGGGQTENIYPDASGSTVVGSGNYSIVGQQQSGVGTPYIVSVGSQQFAVSQTSAGQPVVGKINPTNGVAVKPITWEQIR